MFLFKKNTIFILLVIFMNNAYKCMGKINKNDNNKEILYPKSENIDIKNFKQVIYVSKRFKKHKANGSKSSPFNSIQKAILNIEKGDVAIFVAEGKYNETPIKMAEGINLFGGFDSLKWTRDIIKNKTELSGNKKNRVLIAADSLTIDGFFISDGLIRGQGGGIYFKSASPKISNNIFINNSTIGPKNWNPEYWHEMANDGGAIYFEKESSPIIKNNLFIKNNTEIGRGAGIACNYGAKPVIKNNVFFNNFSGLDDPMRSSDGGAVSIFDWCDAKVVNNIFLSNTAGNRNDGGALFIALWSSAEISKNLFVDNESKDDAGAIFIGGQEHRYEEPLDPIPPEDEFFVDINNNKLIGNRNSSKNSGAMRFTMESRGRFSNNITALNNGIYFQRSEVAVNNNIILDNFLFIETKKGLELGSITNNLIWADFDLLVNATVKNNNILDLNNDSLNYSKKPNFRNDRIIINAFSTNWERSRYCSKIYDPTKQFKPDGLVNRVVKSGDRYSVIIENTETILKIWGDFSGKTKFEVLPSYSLLTK